MEVNAHKRPWCESIRTGSKSLDDRVAVEEKKQRGIELISFGCWEVTNHMPGGPLANGEDYDSIATPPGNVFSLHIRNCVAVLSIGPDQLN